MFRKIMYNGQSKGTIISDVLILLLSLIFSFSQLCVTGDYPACLIFCFFVTLVILIKYLKIEY